MPAITPLPPLTQPTRGLITWSQCGIVKPKRTFNLFYTTTRSPLPRNPVLALRDPNWKLAMEAEYNALIEIRFGS